MIRPKSVGLNKVVHEYREQQKKLVDAGMELAAAKGQGYKPINKTLVDGRKTVVVGVFTNFGGKSRRASSRKTWIPNGQHFHFFEV